MTICRVTLPLELSFSLLEERNNELVCSDLREVNCDSCESCETSKNC